MVSTSQMRSKVPDNSVVDWGCNDTAFRMRCCAAVDESGRPSYRSWMRERKEEKERKRESGGEADSERGGNRGRWNNIYNWKRKTATTSTFYSQQMHPCRGWRNSQDTMLPPNDAPCTSHRRRRRFPRLSRPAKTTSNSTLTNDSASPMPRLVRCRAVFRVGAQRVAVTRW